MNKVIETEFSHIHITKVIVQDRIKRHGYFHTSVNFTLKRTGQKLQKVKKYSSKATIRAEVPLLCAEINALYSHAEPVHEVSSIRSTSSTTASIPDSSNCGDNLQSSFLRNSKAKEDKKGGNIKPFDIMKLLYVEVMGKLKGAISSGNFAELWDGPYLEMQGKDGVTFVSDCSPFQHSQLIKQATALYYFYESLLGSHKKMKAYNIARTKLVGGMSLRTIIELVSSFEKNDYTLKVNMKGHHERRWIVLHDDVWGKTLRDFVRTESVRKGKKI